MVPSSEDTIPESANTLDVSFPGIGAEQPHGKNATPALAHSARKYEVGQVIAKGGMGAILNAREASLERVVAMKVMLNADSPDSAARFVNEAKVTGQLEHPNIVPVHELGVDDKAQTYYTMKLVHGVTLRKVLEDLAKNDAATVAKYPLADLLTIFQKVCDAMAFAHSKGIIHRDLKPENIMLGDFGEVLVMDWGLAKILSERNRESVGPKTPTAKIEFNDNESATQATMQGAILGTLRYMAPEQAKGFVQQLDARSDIYALGGILYHILALRTAVDGPNANSILVKVCTGKFESPIEIIDAKKKLPHLPGGRVPESMSAVVMKAMALEQEDRYQRVTDLQRDIAAYQKGFATSAENAGVVKQVSLMVKRNKGIFATAFAAWLVITALLAWFIFNLRASELETRRQAEIALSNGQKASAEAARANLALANLKKTAPSLLALAESEAGFQRFDSALEKLDTAVALDPGLVAGWWRRVWLLLGMERYAEAAAAFRAAQQRDPAEHAHDKFLTVLDALAAAPDDNARFTAARTDVIFQHLNRVGASGELNAFTKRMTLGAKQKEQLVRKRVDEWLGKNMGVVNVLPDGTVKVGNFPHTLDTIEPLHGLPICRLEIGYTQVKSLEPLRGMELTEIRLDNTAVTDLSPLRGMALTSLQFARTSIADLAPLRGMPLTSIHCDGSKVADLSPLAGMPLHSASFSLTQVRDIGPLRGAPLENFSVLGCGIIDFSALRGAPLKYVDFYNNECTDLSFLADSPVEGLNCYGNHISDLSPLRGKPLKYLYAGSNKIADLRPLAGMPLKDLSIEACNPNDYVPLLELRQLEKLRISRLESLKASIELLRQHPSLRYIAVGYAADSPYRPVAEFWKEYDAKKARGK